MPESGACAALRLYKPSCSHPSSHSITPTHTRGLEGKREKTRHEEPTGPLSILVSCTCTLFRPSPSSSLPGTFTLPFDPLTLALALSVGRSFFLSFFLPRLHIQTCKLRVLGARGDAPPPLPVRLGILQNCDRFFSGYSLTYGASMKITYTGLTGDPVRSIDGGASAAWRAVKTILKNLKWWCAKSWRGKAVRVALKGNWQQDRPDEIKVSCGKTMPKMIVTRTESRNRDLRRIQRTRCRPRV